MAIDYSKLRSATAREVTNTLIQDGFTLKRTRGSHHRYHHSDGRRVAVSYHMKAGLTRARTWLLRTTLSFPETWYNSCHE